MPEQRELKPCPFCGKKPRIINRGNIPRICHLKSCYLFSIQDTIFIKNIEVWNTRSTEMMIIEEIRCVMKDIQLEIESRPQYSNVGKRGCWNKLSNLVNNYEIN